jgi:hypothetical protein
MENANATLHVVIALEAITATIDELREHGDPRNDELVRNLEQHQRELIAELEKLLTLAHG